MRSLQNTAMRAFGCAISAGLLLVAGAGDAAAQAVQATDGRGATIRLAQPARRIITLVLVMKLPSRISATNRSPPRIGVTSL